MDAPCAKISGPPRCFSTEVGPNLRIVRGSHMASVSLPSQEVLRQLLDYDPETGVLTWRTRDAEWFAHGRLGPEHVASVWNARYSGKAALTSRNSGGAHQGPILGTNRLAHRVAWKMVHGDEPEMIDHINGDPSDNRLSNLRAANAGVNAKNTKKRRTNTSGMMGVQYFPYGRVKPIWVVRIGNDHIGCFATKEEAMAERKRLEEAYGFHENHGRVG